MYKVLIIEDEEYLREIYKEQFGNDGFTVEVSVDGQEGLEKLSSFIPDVVLLDLFMPRMNGFEVLKIIKSNPLYRDIEVMIITNINADSQDLLKTWGVAYFLLKVENNPGQIVEKVRLFLENKQKLNVGNR